jgi:hypothetical protein
MIQVCPVKGVISPLLEDANTSFIVISPPKRRNRGENIYIGQMNIEAKGAAGTKWPMMASLLKSSIRPYWLWNDCRKVIT